MDIKWLEDFLALAETRNFSRAAAQRNVTQPAFSRRIRALESWLGNELFDRAAYPTALTPAGKAFRDVATELLRQLYDTRSVLQGTQKLPDNAVRFAAAHTLSLTHLPGWLGAAQREFGALVAQVTATNVHDGVLSLIEGGCDFLLCYQHPRLPLLLSPERFMHVRISDETLRPYATCDRRGRADYALPGTAATPVPHMAYAPGAFLGKAVALILEQSPRRAHLRLAHQADMTDALKALLLLHKGVAWLPSSAALREVEEKRLVALDYDGDWTLKLEINLYRARENLRPVVGKLWRQLTAHTEN